MDEFEKRKLEFPLLLNKQSTLLRIDVSLGFWMWEMEKERSFVVGIG